MVKTEFWFQRFGCRKASHRQGVNHGVYENDTKRLDTTARKYLFALVVGNPSFLLAKLIIFPLFISEYSLIYLPVGFFISYFLF